MLRNQLYPFPFDCKDYETLTLQETVAAMRKLEHELNLLLPAGWRWNELRIFVIERRSGSIVYEVERNGQKAGRAAVALYPIEDF